MSLIHCVIVAQDKSTVLRTVSLSRKSLLLCVTNIFLWISSWRNACFLYPSSVQHDNLPSTHRNCHWIFFWRDSVM